MSADDTPPLEEQLPLLLAACDDALAAGAPAESACDAAVPPELRPRLEREVAWCRFVRRLWPRSGVGDTATGESVPAAAAMPERVGRFLVRRELGRGGFGVVYLAYDPQLRREVALKVPRPGALASPELRARFRQEARAAAGLEHPNLVPVHEAGEAEGVCYIASAYCPGPSLAAWLRQRPGPVPSRDAAGLVLAIARAVHYAHARGIVHRDLKPANILLAGKPEIPNSKSEVAPSDFEFGISDFSPKVTDFGLAKLLEHGDEATAVLQTQTGAIVGTPAYMAPEQAEGKKDVGPAADVYALGAILYQLLTGRPPFQADTPLETLWLVRSQEPAPPRRLNRGVPRDLETVCLKCLRKEPEKRYASAQELADDLGRFLAAEPVRARRVSALGRLALWGRRNPALGAAVTVAVVGIAAASGVGLWRVLAERDRFRHERDQAQANLYRALVGEARARLAARDTGWRWGALDNLAAAARLEVADRDPVALRELAVECLGSQYGCFRLRETWAGHGRPVAAVALRGDGRLAASGADDRAVRLWSVPGGVPLAVLSGHAGPITALAFHPDGKRLASASWDGSVRLWDIGADGRQAGPPRTWPLGSAVRGVACSPDGAWLAAACHDGTVRLLAVAPPGAEALAVRVLRGHAGSVGCVAFAPDGRTLASGGADRAIRLWEVPGGVQRAAWPLGHAPITLAFDPDGGSLAWAEPEGYSFAMKALRGPLYHALPQVHTGPVHQVCFTGDGFLVTASGDGSLKAWGPAFFKDVPEWAVGRGEFGAVRAAAAVPGVVVAGYQDGKVRLWELAAAPERALLHNSGCQSAAFLGPSRRLAGPQVVYDFSAGMTPKGRRYGPGPVPAVAVHPDGRRFAFPDKGDLRLWDLPGRRQSKRWRAHARDVTALAGSPDGRLLASASAGGAVKVWSWEDGRLRRALDPGIGAVHGVAWGPDGGLLAATGERGVVLWDLADDGKPRRLRAYPSPADTGAVAFSPEPAADGGLLLALSGPGGTVEVCDARSGRTLHALKADGSAVDALAFSPDGKVLAADHPVPATVRLWCPASGKEVAALDLGRLRHPALAGRGLAFDPRGQYLAAAGGGSVVFCDLRERAPAGYVSGSLASPAFLPGGEGLLAGTLQGGVRLLPRAWLEQALAAARGRAGAPRVGGPVLVEGGPVVVPGGHSDATWGVAASPDGRWLATAGHDATVNVWDARTLALVRSLPLPAVGWGVAFSPDSRYLAAGSARRGTGVITVWEADTGRAYRHFEGHRMLVTALAFHPDGRRLASGSIDGSVRLWDLKAGRPLGLVHQFEQEVYGVAFRPNGRWLAASCLDHHVAVWDVGGELALPAPPRLLEGHTAGVYSVGFSADGRYLASGSEGGTIILWDGETFARRVTLRGGTGQVRCVRFSQDGELLAGAAYVAPTLVWDLPALRRRLGAMGLDW